MTGIASAEGEINGLPEASRDETGSSREERSYSALSRILVIPPAMFFLGLTSAMIVRKGVSDDWAPVPLPWVLYWNTAVLLASAVTFEVSLRTLSSARRKALIRATILLGMLFVGGQLFAWHQMAGRDIDLSGSPSAAFFYVLTGTHGAFLLCGLGALSCLFLQTLRHQLTGRRRAALRTAAVFWHVMSGVWVYLLFLMRLLM